MDSLKITLCSYFKRWKDSTSGDSPFIKVTGKCCECGASLIRHCLEESDSENGIINNFVLEDNVNLMIKDSFSRVTAED